MTDPDAKPRRVRSWLGLDKRPLTRYDIILLALVGGCYIAEPDLGKTLIGVASVGAGLALAAFGK